MNIDAVKKQLLAYNNRDIDSFMECFSDDCIIEDGQGNIIMQGHESIYKSYQKMFNDSFNLHCEIKSRIVLSKYVVDEELVTGRFNDPNPLHVIAIYSLENDIIVAVRFLK